MPDESRGRVLSFEDRKQARAVQRLRELRELAPELVRCEVTDGIRWTELSWPFPSACHRLVQDILERERAEG